MQVPFRTSLFRASIVGLLSAGSGLGLAAPPVSKESPLVLVSPLQVHDAQSDDSLTRLAFDITAYQRFRDKRDVIITAFPLDRERTVDLELRTIEIFKPNARIVLGTANGDVPLPEPDVLLFGGIVAGHPNSTVFLGISPHGTNGRIELDEDEFIISTGPGPNRTDAIVYNLRTLPPNTIKWKDWTCHTVGAAPPADGRKRQSFASRSSANSTRGAASPSFLVEIAIETDFEFTNDVFEGDADAAGVYVATLVGAASEIFTRDVASQFSISFLRLWETNDDPWNASDSLGQFDELVEYWETNETGVARHVTHFLSGKPILNGIASVPGVCRPGLGYGVTSGLAGFFPLPLEDHNELNRDIRVFAHELGHNFGAPHTLEKDPPLDDCFPGGCTSAPNGTLMSRCAVCPGGSANYVLRFHERIIAEDMLPFLTLEVGCDLGIGPATVFLDPRDSSACVGGVATMAAGAGGEALAYQWRKDGVDLPGATSATLTVDPVMKGDDGLYDAVVSNAEATVISAAAALTPVDCTFAPSGPSGCRAMKLVTTDFDLSAPVAFQFSSPDRPCLSGNLDLNGIFVEDPEFHPVGEWTDLILLGADFVPDTVYEVRMNYGDENDPRWTEVTEVRTELFGDVAGNNVDGVWEDPDGDVSILDIVAGIACFVSAPGAPPLERCDLFPAEPDGSIEIIDILQAVSGLQGVPYSLERPPCP